MIKLADIRRLESIQTNANRNMGLSTDLSVFNGEVTDLVWEQKSDLLRKKHALPRDQYAEWIRSQYEGDYMGDGSDPERILAMYLGKEISIHVDGKIISDGSPMGDRGVDDYYTVVQPAESRYFIEHFDDYLATVKQECKDASVKFAPFFDSYTPEVIETYMVQSAEYWGNQVLNGCREVLSRPENKGK